MKKRTILLLPLAFVGAAIISFAGDKPADKPAAAPDISELRTEIADLQAKVQKLEDHVKGLESTVTQMKQPHLTPLTVPQPNGPFLNPQGVGSPHDIDSRPPNIWGERKINGWTFYIVPCEQKTP